MAWADMDDIGELMQYSGNRIRALCVITGNQDAIRPRLREARRGIRRAPGRPR